MQADSDRNGPRNHRERLEALGIQLPTPPTPLGNYVETALVGSLLFTSGILPVVDGKLLFTGRLGADLTVEQGQMCTLRDWLLSCFGSASGLSKRISCSLLSDRSALSLDMLSVNPHPKALHSLVMHIHSVVPQRPYTRSC